MGSGRGAWSYRGKDNSVRTYAYVDWFTRDGARREVDLDHEAVWWGVRAIQQRLKRLGYRHPILGDVPTNGKFGPRTRYAVKQFQRDVGLNADGFVGSFVAAELWRGLVAVYGGDRSDVLWGQMQLESAGDPGAVSSVYRDENGPDLGLCQINLRFNPEVSKNAAFTPALALSWSAARLSEAYARYAWKSEELQRNCAIAHHNNPTKARRWYEDGIPPDEQILEYVTLVEQRASTWHA